MSEAAVPDCDVCGLQPRLGVASSTLGPISLSYCGECNGRSAEPEWLCKAAIEMCGGYDNIGDWVKTGITFYADGAYHLFSELAPPNPTPIETRRMG